MARAAFWSDWRAVEVVVVAVVAVLVVVARARLLDDDDGEYACRWRYKEKVSKHKKKIVGKRNELDAAHNGTMILTVEKISVYILVWLDTAGRNRFRMSNDACINPNYPKSGTPSLICSFVHSLCGYRNLCRRRRELVLS
jgi:hypothetical protein